MTESLPLILALLKVGAAGVGRDEPALAAGEAPAAGDADGEAPAAGDAAGDAAAAAGEAAAAGDAAGAVVGFGASVGLAAGAAELQAAAIGRAAVARPNRNIDRRESRLLIRSPAAESWELSLTRILLEMVRPSGSSEMSALA